MPSFPIQLKRNGTAAATPSSLLHGEVALNYADGKLFWKDASNVIQSFTFQAYALSSHTHAASDITSGTLDAARIANDSITYAKLQNVSATDRLLGRSSAGAGDVEEITCTAFGRSLIDDADAAAARSTLSVQPTASPAFTGAATVSSGNIGVSTSVGSAPTNGTAHALLLTSTTTAAVNVGPAVFFKGQTGNNTADYGFAGIQGVKDSSSSQNYAGALVFFVQTGGGASALSEAMRCRTDHSTGAVLTVMAGQLQVTAGSGSSGSYKPGVAVSGDDDTGLQQVGGANTISLVTQGTERVRVDASGNVNVGTTDTNPAGNNVAGVRIDQSGLLNISRNQDIAAFFNRKGNDGAIIWFLQEGTVEGDISVAGNTVSYNAFCGSHWAQLIDGSRPAILRGTVLDTIDEMCEWPGEPKNDRLPRVKVSDTPRSRRVYGVFMAWDEDYASTGDMYATALGAYMVRVSGTVQAGDLLESAGDGTARTQPDDIVRSSTIGKVSSTHRVAEYDDGSYLVPCVLMCG